MASRRRRGADQPRTLVAAAKKIDLSAKNAMVRRERWQNEGWLYLDEVPEVKSVILWRAAQLAKMRLFVGTRPPGSDPDDDPIPVTDPESGIDPSTAVLLEARLHSLRGLFGGQAAILSRLEQCLEVNGEGYIVGFAERPPQPGDPTSGKAEEWRACSVDEVEVKTVQGRKRYGISDAPDVKDADKRWLDEDAGDAIFRVWQPHGRYFELADCHLRAVLTECELVTLLNAKMRGETRASVFAGLFVMPNDLTLGPINKTKPENGQSSSADPVMDDFEAMITRPLEDPSDPSSAVPGVLRGPRESLGPDVLRKIELARPSDGSLDARIEGRIERIARGLNAPVEVAKGSMNTTFSNAAQIDQDIFEDYVEPRAVFLVDALTVGYLHPLALDRDNVAPEVLEQVFVWFDASALFSKPNAADAADTGVKEFLISESAWRRERGYSEADAPDAIEVLVRWALTKGSLAANVTNALIELLDGAPALPAPDNPTQTDGAMARRQEIARLLAIALKDGSLDPSGAPAGGLAALRSLAVPSASTSLARRPPQGLTLGRRLTGIDANLRERVIVASNAQMTRALEHAGNRLRSRAKGQRDLLRQVPAIHACATLGPSLVAATGVTDEELLEGAFDALEESFLAWGSNAQRQAIDLVYRAVGGFSTARRDALGLRMADDLAEAWTWMRGALLSLARAQLYDPTPVVSELGEFDPTLRVPPGLVRQAVARAGGSAGLVTGGGGDAWVVLSQAGTKPAGGVATGDLIMGALRDEGGVVEGYVWDYGAAQRMRPFQPHVELDGLEFTNFDDAVLANTSGWPEFAFFMPGDHSGCLCDAVPIVITQTGSSRVVPEEGVA